MNNQLEILRQLDSIGKGSSGTGRTTASLPNTNKLGYPVSNRDATLVSPFQYMARNEPLKSEERKIDQTVKIASNSAIRDSRVSIDTNLGSVTNTNIISEINSYISKLRTNVETGSFFFVVLVMFMHY